MTVRTRPRGRPRGATSKGAETRDRLYRLALEQFARRGFAETTLREIAAAAGVSVGLVYRYFPTKHAIVLALYDDLSRAFAERAARLPRGPWRERFSFLVADSLAVLRPHRTVLHALVPILVSTGEDGLFSPRTAPSRLRVQTIFEEATRTASDVPPGLDGAALGRVLYLVHLAVILWWLLDGSPQQRTTAELVAFIGKVLGLARLALVLPSGRALVRELDELLRRGLLGPARAGGRP
jgi:AcrR family transcriptional regulator